VGRLNRLLLVAAGITLVMAMFRVVPVFADDFAGRSAYRKGDFAAARAAFGAEAADSPVSQFFLALMDLRGEGGRQDMEKGMVLLRESANRGYFAAQYLLGTRYLYGIGVAPDKVQAKRLLADAAARRDYRATALQSILERGSRGEKRDRSAVVAAVRKAVGQGKAAAQHTLAFMYLIGDGVPKDPSQELLWYRAAAAGGDSRANFMLSLMYYHGDGVPRNPAEAARLMRAAAESGGARAEFFMGSFYYNGTGVPQDKAQAARWIGKAAEKGYAEAEHAYGMLLLSGDGVPVDKAKAVQWLAKAAKQGDEGAQAVLRELVGLRTAPSVEPDLLLTSQRASEGHNNQASGGTYLQGKGVVLDKGDYSLKFSLPDLEDAYAPPSAAGSPPNLKSQFQGGKFEIIFKTGK